MLTRRLALRMMLTVAAVWAIPADAAEPRRPNVLFIMADDLNCNLGCYGDPLAVSPNIDRLAQHAVRFDRAYCQYPVCNGSRSSMLSGTRTDTTGISNNATPTRANLAQHVFLPQAFRNAGYRTVKFGKIYHAVLNSGDLFEDPASWDEDLREDSSAKNPPEEQIRETYKKLSAIRLKCADEVAWDGKIARLAVKALNDLSAKDQPFFLAVGFRRPHTPYMSPDSYWDLFNPENLPGPVEPEGHVSLIPPSALKQNSPVTRRGIDEKDWRQIRQAYRAAIAYMDAQVGLLLDAVDKQNLWDNTIVVFVSDHGYHLGEHGGLWHKGTLFEEATRVPYLVAAPGGKKGVVSEALVELVDLYPTLTSLCGVPAPSSLEGSSFAPLLKDPELPWKTGAFTVVVRGNQESSPKFSEPVSDPQKFAEKSRKKNEDRGSSSVTGRTVRTDRWRYTEWNEGRDGVELYDHDNDPREYRNLANDPASAQVRQELSALLKSGWSACVPPAAK
ncbi:sulfatase [Planctomicrobium sp. SH664]|uniref:sulfatase n=1 Tax=Planctomicrobium sp. SH664 TaxID=3448125 RepID=UPI003F5B38F0